MPGRHVAHGPASTDSRRPRRLLAIVLSAVAVAGGGLVVRAFVVAGDGDDECDDVDELSVVADPSISDAMSQAADTYSTSQACATVTVTAEQSSETKNTIADSAADLWIPDSTIWRAELANPEIVNSVGSVASAPLVAVMPRTVAEEELGWPNAGFAWADAISADTQAAIADPVNTTEGLITLIAVRSALGEQADPTAVVGAMTQVSGNVIDTVDDGFSTVGTEDGPMMFTATEQAVVAHNRSDPEVPVVGLYPEDGTLTLDYPALVVADSPNVDPATKFAEYLSRNQEAVLEAGFRDRNNEIRADNDVGVIAQSPELLAKPDRETVAAMTKQWAALSLDMRMLAVIDVSGSMNLGNEEGVLRVEQTRDAAQNAMGMLRETGSLGLWVFSTPEDQESGGPYTELVELGPLTGDVDDGTRKEAIAAGLTSLPDLVDAGGTALYDTTLAGFREVEAGYEEGKINSVVVMTDGVNEDYVESISLDTLIGSLESQFDPAQPVAIIMIGIGDGVDMEVLQEISQATGSKAYHAATASDIETVFLQAMIDRQCRPNC